LTRFYDLYADKRKNLKYYYFFLPASTVSSVASTNWLELFAKVCDAVDGALSGFKDWSEPGERPDQYLLDQVADRAALAVLKDRSIGILSEESGLSPGSSGKIVIIDPVDGSTNASRRIGHYCVSLCAVDNSEPVAAMVFNLATGECFTAEKDRGSKLDGKSIHPTSCSDLGEAIVGISGNPALPIASRQYRAFGAAALDLCSVACGRLDGFMDPISGSGVWDYAAGVFICEEAGAFVGEMYGNELMHFEHDRRLGPMAAATSELLEELSGTQRPDS
jgi:fructose-1,6-bisphosphatase/inositol monophosphatase family enzyme